MYGCLRQPAPHQEELEPVRRPVTRGPWRIQHLCAHEAPAAGPFSATKHVPNILAYMLLCKGNVQLSGSEAKGWARLTIHNIDFFILRLTFHFRSELGNTQKKYTLLSCPPADRVAKEKRCCLAAKTEGRLSMSAENLKKQKNFWLTVKS